MAPNPDHHRLLRPLLPVPQIGAAAHSGHAAVPQKRVQIKNACQPCRKRKAKCNGAQPRCLACEQRGEECDYEDRTQRCRKRKHWDMEEQLSTHQQLFDIMRSGREDEALDIVRRIQRGQDAGSLLRQLRGGNLLLQLSLAPESWYRYGFPLTAEMPLSLLRAPNNPYLKSLIYEQAVERPPAEAAGQGIASQTHRNALIQYHVPYHAARVVDPRLGSGHLQEWTCVAANGEVLQDLLQTYFLSEYPMFPFLHKDSFLDDMVKGRRRFCSSLLVNAILAAGCQSYAKLANRTEFWNPETLQYRFSAEARRLWELEVDAPTITTVQAGLIMSLTCNVNGIDKVGWSYLVQTTAMAARLQLFGDVSSTAPRKVQAATRLTAWSLFVWQSMFCFHYYRPPLLRVPPRSPLPNSSDQSSWYPKIWVMYPLQQDPTFVHFGDHFKATAEFHVILNSIGSSVFPRIGARAKISSQQVRDDYNRLIKWYRDLPYSLSIRRVVFPWQLSLHMHYFNIIDWLMVSFQTSLEEDGDTEPRVTFPADSGGEAMADAIALGAKTNLETVFRLYYMRHGFGGFDPLLLQFHSYVGFMALNNISDKPGQSPSLVKALQSTLALAALGLRDFGKSSYLSDTIFRLLRDTAASQRALPANEITVVHEEDGSQKAQIARHVNSQFPINVVSITDDPEAQRVESLIADYKMLDLRDQSDASEDGGSPGVL